MGLDKEKRKTVFSRTDKTQKGAARHGVTKSLTPRCRICARRQSWELWKS